MAKEDLIRRAEAVADQKRKERLAQESTPSPTDLSLTVKRPALPPTYDGQPHYIFGRFIDVTFPHSERKDAEKNPLTHWERTCNDTTLVVDCEYGIPCGMVIRQELRWITTQIMRPDPAVLVGNRLLLGSSRTAHARELRYKGNYKGGATKSQRFDTQIARLYSCRITVTTRKGKNEFRLAEKYQLWDDRDVDQAWIDLRPDFIRDVRARAVPLRPDILDDPLCKRSPRFFDVMTWLPRRLAELDEAGLPSDFIPLGSIEMQLGTGIARHRTFRDRFRKDMEQAKDLYASAGKLLVYQFGEDARGRPGLFLYQSDHLIPQKRKRGALTADVSAEILEAKALDDDTRKQAEEVVRGSGWMVRQVEGEFFPWLEKLRQQAGFVVNDVRGMFLKFAKTHIKNNPPPKQIDTVRKGKIA